MSPELTITQLLKRTRPLPRSFFERPADLLAPALLGTVLVHQDMAGMIVETEAYLGADDLASHAARGFTRRTSVMFGPAGHAYVYLIYGIYECLNVVAGPVGVPHCVLVRALEPLVGLPEMARRRNLSGPPFSLANGPGKLTRAMGVTLQHYGVDLCAGPPQLRHWKIPPALAIEVTPRIGIKDNADWPLRFIWSKNACLSRR